MVAIWRQNLMPASFRGVPFKVATDSKNGGRRIVPHEFPKRDTPYAEDMGRRIRHYRVEGYVIYNAVNNPDYQAARDALIAALESDAGPGQLVHPTLGVDTVMVDTFNVIEHKEQGGMASFEIEFYEAGQATYSNPTVNTQAQSNSAAQSAIQSFQGSSDIEVLSGTSPLSF
jgi:prophage DNA circulation protein